MTLIKILGIAIGIIFAVYILSVIQMRAWLDALNQYLDTKLKNYEQEKKK
jgi:hypothetical protein